MESILLELPSHNEFPAETPTTIPVSHATLDAQDYQAQASNLSGRSHSETVNSNEYANVLYRVYEEEMHNHNIFHRDHRLLIISIQAVFLEAGFICLDSVAEKKKKIAGFHLPVGWASKPTVHVQYTLQSPGVQETVGLKFQTMGKFVYVHGALNRNGHVGFVRLDASRFVPSISFICTLNSDSVVPNEDDGYYKPIHERKLYELWKIVRDGLALPLLTDLCLKTGLEPPPCFTTLHMDFKLKILESLPAIDLARVCCVSSELRYLSSNNDLWKQKYMEEFTLSDSAETSEGNWKDKYVTSKEQEKRMKRERARQDFTAETFRLNTREHQNQIRANRRARRGVFQGFFPRC